MSGIIFDDQQSEKFDLDEEFWIGLYHLETSDCGSEYTYSIACQLKQLEAQGFINPYKTMDKPSFSQLGNNEKHE